MAAVKVFLCIMALCSSTRAVGKQSFYILFADQVQSNTWPEKVCQNNGKGPQGSECVDARKYSDGIFIVSPQNFTAELVQRVKKDVPGSRLVIYFDFGDMPLAHSEECPFCQGHIMGDKYGRNCSTTYTCGPSPFLNGLQSVFPSKDAVHDITNGTPGVMVESYPGLAKYIWNNKSTPILAKYLSDYIKENQFDGIYLDGYIEPDRINFEQCTTAKEGCTSFLKSGHIYDVNGDGVEDSSEVVYATYFGWAPAFVTMMRRNLGSSAVLLANSAGAISHPSLSGITIEMESCVGTSGQQRCIEALQSQYQSTMAMNNNNNSNAVSIFWLTHSEALPPSAQCALVAQWQQQYPFVQAGTDFFDGSHVVC
eukprot:m.35663 g.35663  ORF g.35663 m.35663 type:complete len:367 (-) comp8923_c1_seq2:179-1279(-)